MKLQLNIRYAWNKGSGKFFYEVCIIPYYPFFAEKSNNTRTIFGIRFKRQNSETMGRWGWRLSLYTCKSSLCTQIGRKTDIQTERQKDIDASVHSYIPPFSGRLHYFFSFHTIADFVLWSIFCLSISSLKLLIFCYFLSLSPQFVRL